MDRRLDSLSSDFKPLAMEVLARLVERGIAVLIVQTSRTPAEHAANLANGTSATAHSQHLPRRLRGLPLTGSLDDEKADAIDLCPYASYQLRGTSTLQWETTDPAWAAIGEIGEALGLRWGGRWKRPHDPGHLEWQAPAGRR
jgi:hypothetical protein